MPRVRFSPKSWYSRFLCGNLFDRGPLDRGLLGWRGRTILEHHIADGRDRPARRSEIVLAIRPPDAQFLAEQADLVADVFRQLHGDQLDTGRGHRFDAAGAGAPTDAVEEIAGRAELALNDGPFDQRVIQRQDADRRRIL